MDAPYSWIGKKKYDYGSNLKIEFMNVVCS
jgi:hypothetical protein